MELTRTNVLRLLVLLFFGTLSQTSLAEVVHQSSLFSRLGDAKYGPDFRHYDYVNPDAPKGGEITLATVGTYDNFNRYASRGHPGVNTDTLYDALFTSSDDDLSGLYPLIATSARYSDDFRWAEIAINPQARFEDGSPVTAQDVVFTFHKFMTEGVPQFRIVYKGVSMAALTPLTVRIELPQPDKDMMLGLFTLPVIPQKFWQTRQFNEPLPTPPLSGAAYHITDYKSGQYIVYSRVTDYWAADLPVNKGRNNFDTIRYNYYRDDNVAFEAFKAGAVDLRTEASAKKWVTQYTGPKFTAQDIIKKSQPNRGITDTTRLAFNVEKTPFQDVRVREALTLVFNFEWMNKTLYYSSLKRPGSYFQNTEYAASALPDEHELAILAPYRGKIPDEVFNQVFQPPASDISGYDRPNLLRALALLRQAGWEIHNHQLVNRTTGKPFHIELLLPGTDGIEWTFPFRHNLSRLGITLDLRQTDPSQYLRRLRQGDYEMVANPYPATPWPGRTLQMLWDSHYINSSWNRSRVGNPVIDDLLTKIMQHQGDKDALLPLGRALDRVLLWNYYMIPMWYNAEDRYAWWNKFSMPAINPTYALGIDTWWFDGDKATQITKQ